MQKQPASVRACCWRSSSRTAERMRQMRITPRYDGAAVINVDAVVRSPSAALVRQRARLAESLRGLSTGEWNTPSRCGGWTVQDVVEHLVGVNRFWSLSIQAGLRGEPTRLLASFDPVRVPAAMVEAARGASASATLDSFQATNAELGTLVGSLTDAGLGQTGRGASGAPGDSRCGTARAVGFVGARTRHPCPALAPAGRRVRRSPPVACLRRRARAGAPRRRRIDVSRVARRDRAPPGDRADGGGRQ